MVHHHGDESTSIATHLPTGMGSVTGFSQVHVNVQAAFGTLSIES